MGHFGSFCVFLQTVYVCVYTEQQDFSGDVFLGESFGSKVILDVGCRAGSTGISLKKSGFQEIGGVDPAREMVNVARDLGIYRELSIGKIGKDEGMSYEDSTYDAIFCIGCFSLGHIQLKYGIPELLRLLKKGGVAVYTVQFSLDKVEAFNDHLPFLQSKQLEILKLENRFCHLVDGAPVDCHVYAIKKLK